MDWFYAHVPSGYVIGLILVGTYVWWLERKKP